MTEPNITSVVAKSEDKTIQISFTVPFPLIKKAQDEVLAESAKDTEIPGFRKGKAPLEKVKEKIPADILIQKSLAKILPPALAKAIEEHKIKPAIYPKFELLSAKENENWQIRATTCELPQIILPDYKTKIKEQSIKTLKEPAKEEKEQKAIKILLDLVKVTLPRLLVSEEVDARLSSLLSRIEKLGLSLEGYLQSIGKTPETLRIEYELQAKNTITLELILNEISVIEKIKVEEGEIDGAIKAAAADTKLAENLNTPEQRRLIRSVLSRRKTLDYLASLV